jgi:hypothetical protein
VGKEKAEVENLERTVPDHPFSAESTAFRGQAPQLINCRTPPGWLPDTCLALQIGQAKSGQE